MVKKFQKPQNRPKELLIVQNSNKKTPKMGPNCQKLQCRTDQNYFRLDEMAKNRPKCQCKTDQIYFKLYKNINKQLPKIVQNYTNSKNDPKQMKFLDLVLAKRSETAQNSQKNSTSPSRHFFIFFIKERISVSHKT